MVQLCGRRWQEYPSSFLAWVAFATTNVVFKDRIISTKTHQFQEMQLLYETRVSDLQQSYDLVISELDQSLSIQKRAMNCIERVCDLETRTNLKNSFDDQVSSLRESGLWPKSLETLKSKQFDQQDQSADQSPLIYVGAKRVLDFLFNLFTGKEGGRLSDETAFHILFLLVWGGVSAVLLLVIQYLGKLVLDKTRRKSSDNEISP